MAVEERQMVEKKRIVLRQDDTELFSARVERNDQEELIVHFKVHEKIEKVFAGGSAAPLIRTRNGVDYYSRIAEGLDVLLNNSLTELSSTYPDMLGHQVSMAQRTFSPESLYLGGGLNFQIFRQVGVGHGDGITLTVNGAITLSMLRAWLLIARAFVARIWQEHMYPVSMEATLTTREMMA